MNTKLWVELGLALVLLVVLASVGCAETCYVAVDGSADNDGSYERPWSSVAHALDAVGGDG